MLLVEQGGLIMKTTKHTKIWICSLCLGLALTLIVQATVLAQDCYEIRDNVVRLHVLANSDSEHDQALKLKVRDALLAQSGDLFYGYTTKEQALNTLESSLEELEQIAEETLKQEGCPYPVTCRLEETYFTTRVYDTVTLPAGNYTALRVLIGEGKGQNWWCVMFPPLCIPAAEEVTANNQTLENTLSPHQQELVENGVKYRAKFKVVEWFQKAAKRWKEWF